jgi:hypothetical protein
VGLTFPVVFTAWYAVSTASVVTAACAGVTPMPAKSVYKANSKGGNLEMLPDLLGPKLRHGRRSLRMEKRRRRAQSLYRQSSCRAVDSHSRIRDRSVRRSLERRAQLLGIPVFAHI